MTELKEFWALVVDVWKYGIHGIEINQALIALAIFVAFLVLRHLFARIVLNRISALARRTSTEFDDALAEGLKRPLRFVFVVIGIFFATRYIEPRGDLEYVVQNTLRSLIVYTIFWSFYSLVEPFSYGFRRLERLLTRPMVEWLVRGLKAAFVFLGAAAILEIWGIAVGPILAGLGLFGVAVALGAQDLFKNLIAGAMILIERRFGPGDWISVDGVVEGTVEHIGFRSTKVRRFDKAPVYVPNAKLSDDALINFSEMTHRRIFWTIGVEYRTSVDQLRQIREQIESHVLESDEFASPQEVSTFVRVDAFDDSSIAILLYCFTKTTVWGEWLEIKERLAYRVKDIVEGAGTAFAFPSQSLYVEALPEGTPETYVPPKDADRDAGKAGTERQRSVSRGGDTSPTGTSDTESGEEGE